MEARSKERVKMFLCCSGPGPLLTLPRCISSAQLPLFLWGGLGLLLGIIVSNSPVPYMIF
jgi:hypothetical protein